MSEQYFRESAIFTVPRWGINPREVVYPAEGARFTEGGAFRFTEDGRIRVTDEAKVFFKNFTGANFATEKPHNFERWQLDAVSGKPYRESELVQFQGRWYRPEHLRDEIAEIRKRQQA